MQPVYLDHNATTPLSGTARRAMEPYLEGQYGNPLTGHVFGAAPRHAVETARTDVLTRFGGAPEQDAWRVVFNSGATEGLNHVLKGLAFASLEGGRPVARSRIVVGALEHYAVKNAVGWLAERFGFEVVFVPPDRSGVVEPDAFLAEVDSETTLVAVLHWANNELGTIQPVETVGRGCRALGVPFVCDAVQRVGKGPIGQACTFADALVISAHKFYGPKGVGALLVRRELTLDALIHGAQQEEGQRGGTHNVAGIVGLAAALCRTDDDQQRESQRLRRLRDLLWKDLRQSVQGAHWNGQDADVLPNTLNVSFDGCPSPALLEAVDRLGFAVSAGAACREGDVKPSSNLLAMGLPESRARTSVRISLGHATSEHAVHRAAEAFAKAAKTVRAAS